MDQKRRSDYKPRPISIRDSQGKPTSQTQQARAFAKYLRDSHWAEPATSRRHPPTGAGVTKPHHYCRAPSSPKTTGAQQSTRPRHPPRRSLAMARPTQPTGPRQSPQPITSHSHHTRRLARSNCRGDIQRHGSTHRPSELQAHLPS